MRKTWTAEGAIAGVKLVNASKIEREMPDGSVKVTERGRGIAVLADWRSVDPQTRVVSYRKSVILRHDDLAPIVEAAGVPGILARFPVSGDPKGPGDPAESRTLVAYLSGLDTIETGTAQDDIVF